VLICLTGCSRGPAGGHVEGEVTLDGKPLDNAVIRLVPIDGQTGTAGGTTKNGKFELQLPASKYRVEISATKMPNGTGEIERHSSGDVKVVELVPEKYNTKSELVLDVHTGQNAPHFDLKSN